MKLLLKTYLVDSVFLAFFFTLVVFSKNYVEEFFDKVSVYEEALLSFNPDLTNATVETITQMDLVIGGFGDLVYGTVIVMLVLIPLALYLVFTFSQSLNLGLLRKKLYWKRVGKSVLLGLPFFVLYLIFEGYITTTLTNFLEIPSQLGLVLLVGIGIIVSGYIWYIGTILLMAGKKLRKNYAKVLYKKAYILFPTFLFMTLIMVLLLSVNTFMAFRYLTESFVQNSLISLILIQLVLLVPIQFLRIWITKKTMNYFSKI
jgi:hypothetical protein